MRWIVGVDPRRGGDGPLHFAAWLQRSTGRRGPADTLRAVYVLERETLSFAAGFAGAVAAEGLTLADVDAERTSCAARGAVEEALGRCELAASVDVSFGVSAEAHLAALARGDEEIGLIVGRRAQRGEERLVRLGRVTRRLLRALPAPVLVVPPDLSPEAIGDGAIIAATDTTDASIAACRFATDLSRRTGKSLILAHAIPPPEVWAPDVHPSERYSSLRAELQSRAEGALSRWARVNRLDGPAEVVVQGDAAVAITELATERRAALIVCGSRCMSPVTRVFVVSMASELAAISWRPVLVVPPDQRRA